MVYKTTTSNSGPRALAARTSVQMPTVEGGAKHAETRITDARANAALKSRRLHRKVAAHYLGVSLSWLDKARMTGRGPAYIAIGSRIVYDVADLDIYLRQNRHETGFGP